MRLSVRISTCLALVSALALSAGNRVVAQTTGPTTSTNGTYVAIDPLAKVTYDNKYDLSVGMAYEHMKAGPTTLQGANLGGLDVSGSYWLTKHWGLQSSVRGYFGTSGRGNVSPNTVKGPVVSEYYFTAGPEWLGPHNKHGAILAHVLAGGVYGDFDHSLHGTVTTQSMGFYNNQIAPAIIAGGHFDLNRSDRLVFRITPDAIIKHYSINYAPNTSQFDVNFGISVGVEYKFKKKR
jgi:hypothetical protein